MKIYVAVHPNEDRKNFQIKLGNGGRDSRNGHDLAIFELEHRKTLRGKQNASNGKVRLVISPTNNLNNDESKFDRCGFSHTSSETKPP